MSVGGVRGVAPYLTDSASRGLGCYRVIVQQFMLRHSGYGLHWWTKELRDPHASQQLIKHGGSQKNRLHFVTGSHSSPRVMNKGWQFCKGYQFGDTLGTIKRTFTVLTGN